ncbi:sulfatase-like hydrolase/transferase, partial [Streptomyces sp. NPDC004609]|uniref:sulfatase-like hydrolase/transferase n=1 Tax=Streptomyces sp. NPDC004609 TaxID=3364704 RepID=UPI00367C81E8
QPHHLRSHTRSTTNYAGISRITRVQDSGSRPTHVPHGFYIGDSTDSVRSQIAALTYVDTHLGRLIDTLTRDLRWLIIMCADHGDAFGEGGYRGRGIVRPEVTNVPFAAWLS